MRSIFAATVIALFTTVVSAQFQFFDQFFGGQQGHQGHQHQEKQNVASDSAWYQQNWQAATCSNYLCPDTLACVAFPHHCPCAFPEVEDKVELAEGMAVCASKGGFKKDETIRKIELARKGLL